MITSKEICQAMDKNQKCKIEGIKPKESNGSKIPFIHRKCYRYIVTVINVSVLDEKV